jgi:hypothetical protein
MRLYDLSPIKHVLKTVSQQSRVPRIVLHFKNNRVIAGGAERQRGIDFGVRKSGYRCLPLLQRTDDAI